MLGILHCDHVKLLLRNSHLAETGYELLGTEQHSLRRIQIFSPISSLLRQQRAPEFRVTGQKDLVGKAGVDEQFDAFRPPFK